MPKPGREKNSSSIRLGLYLTVKCRTTLGGFTIKVDRKSRFIYATRKSLREMAERLADKYEEAKEKQEDIMNRSAGCTILGSLLRCHC